MSLNKLREIFRRAINACMEDAGVEALKKTSLFGSNDK